jgi:RimJ/RimL family protein N-acetyltransferase
MDRVDPWPLGSLMLRTPRLELRPDDDAGLRELVDVALDGVHPPDQMPFNSPWTEADPRYLGRGTLQHHWRLRAALAPRDWTVQFLVRRDGRVIGAQSLRAVEFAVTREVDSGSWLGLAHHGCGLGTEMRAAVLAFAFDHLGAATARSSAFTDNAASLGVSRRLGYVEDGSTVHSRRGAPATQTRLVLSREAFAAHRPRWRLRVTGAAGCLPLLGAGRVVTGS